MRALRFLLPWLLLVAVSPPAVAGGTFTNFESHQIHPIERSLDGTRLFAVNTPDNRLTVFSVSGSGLQIEAEIAVGLEPVSVRQRNADEVWVVNHLSDAVSVIDLNTMNVRATLQTGDEPTDVVFAGNDGRAFVCASQADAIEIYDPDDLSAPPAVVALFGSDPRALATSSDGATVFAVIFEGGNRTSILSEGEVVAGGGPPAPSPPMRPGLPPAPDVGLIIRWNGASWVDETGTKTWDGFVPIPYTLPDYDLAALDANVPIPSPAYYSDVGTLNFNLTVNPLTDVVYVANSEAENLTRFEPNLQGRFAQNRVTLIDPSISSVTAVHLNPHINYAVSPGPPSEIDQSLSQPNGGAWDDSGSFLYLAALGSGRLAVLDAAGAVTARVEVGEGPSGVAVHDSLDRVYVLNRFSNSVAIVDKTALTKIDEVGLGYQPEPPAVTAGRRFLYDARISSAHGDLACASCHAFANFDNVAWDLGDPLGDMAPSIQIGIPDFHPMKGPAATQTLRGLASTEPFHWRGDRADFNRFNPAFLSLMGAADSLDAFEMQAFTDFIMTVVYPPNPNQNLDRSYPDPPLPTPSAERGRIEYTQNPHDASFRCQDCHQSDPTDEPLLVSPGTNGILVPGPALQESQAFKIPQLRNMYEKTGFTDGPGPQMRGFGFLHDGSVDNLLTFLQSPVFQFQNDAQRQDMVAFLHAFDTGTAPSVGAQQTVDGTNNGDPQVGARLATLMAQADLGNVDLVVKGRLGAIARGYLYVGAGVFESDRQSEGTVSETDLRSQAGPGSELTYTAVPPGNGERIGVDRDCDSFRDRDEADAGSDPADPASTPTAVAGPVPADRAGPLLGRNRPNPVGSAGTRIEFTVATPTDVTVKVFDPAGREVAVLMERSRQQGTVALLWDGRGKDGRRVGSGVYFYRLEAGGVSRTRQLVVVR